MLPGILHTGRLHLPLLSSCAVFAQLRHCFQLIEVGVAEQLGLLLAVLL
jgi:hypothetical protein